MKLRKKFSFFGGKTTFSFIAVGKEFLYGSAYLADIFSHSNEVKLSIQGPDLTIMDVTEILQAFQAKLRLWKRRLETDNFANFPMLEEVNSLIQINNTEALAPFLGRTLCKNLDRL